MKNEKDDPAAEANCAICQSPLVTDEAKTACPDCRAVYHADCWETNGGCAVYGCPSVPAGQPRSSAEFPVAYWGQENKLCPSCNKEILAAAVRCRHCGAVFDSARPVDSAEFARTSAFKGEVPRLKKSIISIFIFCLVPFTAPVAAIIGLVWRKPHEEDIRSLPSLYSALLTIGCVVGIGQTVAMVVAAVLLAVFRS